MVINVGLYRYKCYRREGDIEILHQTAQNALQPSINALLTKGPRNRKVDNFQNGESRRVSERLFIFIHTNTFIKVPLL